MPADRIAFRQVLSAGCIIRKTYNKKINSDRAKIRAARYFGVIFLNNHKKELNHG